MKESYAVKPDAVEIYRVGSSTDVILRKNITEVTKTDGDTTYTAWECDEVQFRYPGTLTKAEVEADFDTWWEYGTTDHTATAATAEVSLEQQITDLQVALCEVYELLAADTD